MILANPQSYLGTEDLRNMALDYDLSRYSDGQISDMLVRATAVADSMMHRSASTSLMAVEETLQYRGDDTNLMDLARRPLIYIKKAELVMPGIRGWTLALDQLLVDYTQGFLKIFQPMLWAGSYYAMFPFGATIEVTLAHGYGYRVKPPACTFVDNLGGNLPPSIYDVAVTAQTPWGETTAPVNQVSCSQGSIDISIQPTLGALVYRAFIAPHGQRMVLAGESAHTAYGSGGVGIHIGDLTPVPGYWPDSFPIIDTSAHPYPAALREAVRLIFLSGIYEQTNLANRGVASTRSGEKAVAWRPTTGTGGKGTPTMVDEARAVLAPYTFLGVF